MMLCPIVDKGPVSLFYSEFENKCKYYRGNALCSGCRAGALVQICETVTEFPKGVTIKDISTVMEKVAPKKKNNFSKKEHFSGNDVLNPIPANKLKKLVLSDLRPYWKNEIIPSGIVGPCVNCFRELRSTAHGLCGMCYNTVRNQVGDSILTSLDTCRAKAETMNLKNSVTRKKHEDKKEVKPKEISKAKKTNGIKQHLLVRIKGDTKFEKGVLEIEVEGNVDFLSFENFEIFKRKVVSEINK